METIPAPDLAAAALGWMRLRLCKAPFWGHRWAGWLHAVSSRGVGTAGAGAVLAHALRRPGSHRLAPVALVNTPRDGRRLECWEAADAFVLKALALLLGPFLSRVLSPRCFHLPGRGGCKGAVRTVRDALATGRYRFVARSDARGYYANIRHATLLGELRRLTGHRAILDLVCQYCHRTVVFRGIYRRVEKGIPLGCSLSPLMAAVYLHRLDERLSHLPGVCYARFMDDWVILAETRWKLRRAVRIMNATLAELGLEQHPDKTFIGRVERGFDFLGYDFHMNGTISPSRRAIARLAENVSRLYEQGADTVRVGRYTERWLDWLHAGLTEKRSGQRRRWKPKPPANPTAEHGDNSTQHMNVKNLTLLFDAGVIVRFDPD